MAGLMDLLQQTLGGNATNQIGQQVGANPIQATSAIATALPLILAALSRNASTPQGAQALHQAVTNDHDGAALDQPVQSTDTADGAAILGHVLGDKQQAAAEAVGRTSGLDAGQAASVMAMLAPLVMGALGRIQSQQGLNPGGLASMLGAEHQQQAQTSPGLMGLATQLLDGNHDGSIVDDITQKLGGLFGGR